MKMSFTIGSYNLERFHLTVMFFKKLFYKKFLLDIKIEKVRIALLSLCKIITKIKNINISLNSFHIKHAKLQDMS